MERYEYVINGVTHIVQCGDPDTAARLGYTPLEDKAPAGRRRQTPANKAKAPVNKAKAPESDK